MIFELHTQPIAAMFGSEDAKPFIEAAENISGVDGGGTTFESF